MEIILKPEIFFEKPYIHIHANVAVGNSKIALTRRKKHFETSELDRWIAFDPLYTLSLTLFCPFINENSQTHCSIKWLSFRSTQITILLSVHFLWVQISLVCS